MTTTYSQYFRFGIPDFLSEPWHALWQQMIVDIDRVLHDAFIVGIADLWTNSTAYIIGDIIISPDDGTYWTCGVAHTSAVSPTTFTTDKAAHPTFWTSFSQAVITIASQAEAVAGTDNTKMMTPLRVSQALAAYTAATNIGITTQVGPSYNILTTDTEVWLNGAIGAVLPAIAGWLAAHPLGQPLTIKDVSGAASGTIVTISCPGGVTIDGMATITIESDYGGYRLRPIKANMWGIV